MKWFGFGNPDCPSRKSPDRCAWASERWFGSFSPEWPSKTLLRDHPQLSIHSKQFSTSSEPSITITFWKLLGSNPARGYVFEPNSSHQAC